ncbi:hypothetical protein [Phormidium tenue]|uniref:Uncharacterized protein n=1 Tax=Phormidium tenue NIES-30 TaxID=549789 RepID=A0A1U7J709_9CYAN|nr:hypothetical protein [Phormidium tenue]MBD2232318.1 hypothetical protein [Phormidium tenue FACHB-1052]OKH48750.1 hypothetical protein NIES30_09445 [Phormidium tenue NIES-30]
MFDFFKTGKKRQPGNSISQSQTVNGQISGLLGQSGRDLKQSNNLSESQVKQEFLPLEIIPLIEEVICITKSSNLSEQDLERITRLLESTKSEAKASNPNKEEMAKNLKEVTELTRLSFELFGSVRPLLEKIFSLVYDGFLGFL